MGDNRQVTGTAGQLPVSGAGVLVVVEVGLLAGTARLAAAFSVLMLLLPLALLGAI